MHREKIVSAASVLFMEKGIAQTSMDDIAKAAGYSKATLYVIHVENVFVGFYIFLILKV